MRDYSRPDTRTGNNLETLKALRKSGRKYDLIELDGPYMAGLEDWDNMSEAEYIAHYAERLSLVRDVLQPWGVVFVFGYPEGCAEIKSWAHRTETLYLRRWLHWYKQRTAHKGRKVEIILLFEHHRTKLWERFKRELRARRTAAGMTVKDAMVTSDIRADKVTTGERGGGGFLWFEAESSHFPTIGEYKKIAGLFGFNGDYERIQALPSRQGLTNVDYFDKTYPEETAELNSNGLRSKPVGLYLDLFRPTIPPTENKQALILYGGSGNAGIAAAALGYDVTICEQNAARCKAIEKRWDRDVAIWTQRASAVQKALPMPIPSQGVLI